MKSFLFDERASGILAHITSIPSPFGIGDIGHASYRFLDFLEQAGQRFWQFLPVGPTHSFFDNSPYMSCSAFAGSPLLISCELLIGQGYIKPNRIDDLPEFDPHRTQYDKVTAFKQALLEEAFSLSAHKKEKGFLSFINSNDWLDDYSLFMALKKKYPNQGWFDWPKEIAGRDPKAMKSVRRELESEIDYYNFEQYLFFSQWELLRKKAEEKNIKLIGDIPIYVGADSADVWANRDIFQIDTKTNMPTHIAGVPPDYFSETGQRWGNPLYLWQSKSKAVQEKLFDWWKKRFQINFKLTDIVRIDHFRGFADYWSIPAEEETAINGKWFDGPGERFFNDLSQELGDLPIIAEDLGIITKKVVQLRDKFGFPGMKILQFAFDDNMDNSFLPHNFTTCNCVIYTGTHDNDTTLGWFLSDSISEDDRKRIKLYANRVQHDPSPIHQDLIHVALGSIAALAIVPLQDILGYGSDCRMNIPATSKGNWRWRCALDALNEEAAVWLKEKTELFGRSVAYQSSENGNET